MDFSKLSKIELIKAYGELLNEMYARELIRSKNVTGDLGEYIVIDDSGFFLLPTHFRKPSR